MEWKSKLTLAQITLLTALIFYVFYYVCVTHVKEQGEKQQNNNPERKSVQYKNGDNNMLSKDYLKQLCKTDAKKIATLTNANLKDSSTVLDIFHSIIQNPLNSLCREKQSFGGNYRPKCKYRDGQKFVCMDDILKDIANGECLIYSFGILDDWSFEDYMADLGCTIYAYDPSVNFPAVRRKNVFFKKIGVGVRLEEKKRIYPFKDILSQNGHQNNKISYLKMDIEGYEREGLPSWLELGDLDNVQQIGLEFHLSDPSKEKERTKNFLRTIQDLYTKGRFGLINYDPNGCWKNNAKSKYYSLAEIVMKKINYNPCEFEF